MATKKKIENNTPEKGIVIQNIQVRPIVRQSQDIEKWRNALRNAEALNGNRVSLYDLYEEVLLDGHLTSLLAKRILGVTKTRLKFVDKAGKEVPAIMELLAKKTFRELRKEIMRQKFWGIGVVELIKENDQFRIFSVPRKHIRPETGKIVSEQQGSDGIYYRTPPFDKYVLELGHHKDLGLILQACQYVIYKRGGFGDWANFAQIFGTPFREAKWDGYNLEVRKQLEFAMENMGNSGYVILPEGSSIQLHEASNAQSNGELYNTLRRACNDELSVLILGQTETTNSSASSGYAQSKTHANVEASINHDDMEDEIAVLNEQVIPILKNLGYPADGMFVHEPEAEQVSLKDRTDIIDTVRNKIKTPVDDDYVYETTGIPKPKNYDQLKADMESASAAAAQAAALPPEPAKDKKKKPAADPAKESKLSFSEKISMALTEFFAHAPKNS